MRGMAPIGETVKNTAIVTWLFGGLVPALIAVNSFAFTKLSSPALRGLCFKPSGDGAKMMALASLGAPDLVLEGDATKILDAFASPDESLFVPLAVAIGAPGGGEGDYLGANATPRPLPAQGDDSRKARQAPDAASTAFDVGEGQRLRRAVAYWALELASKRRLLGPGAATATSSWGRASFWAGSSASR